jgi:hypothetical protein
LKIISPNNIDRMNIAHFGLRPVTRVFLRKQRFRHWISFIHEQESFSLYAWERKELQFSKRRFLIKNQDSWQYSNQALFFIKTS